MKQKQRTTLTENLDVRMLDILDETERRKYSEYRAKFNQASEFKVRLNAPAHVDIELDNYCNYRCSFCEIGKPNDQKKEYYKTRYAFDRGKVYELLEECTRIGVRSIQFSVVNEPLANKDLLDVVEYANKLNFSDIFFYTNGSLLNKEISKRLILSGLTKITFSLDAFSDEIYRKTRKSKMYSRVVAKINEFLALKTEMGASLPLTKVTFIVMDENRHEVDEFGQYWKGRVDAIAIQGLINIDEKKEIARTVKDIGKYRCNMPYIRLTVKANGDVLPCCIYYGEDLPFGNVYRNTIAEVWNSSEFNEFQKMHKDYRWHDNLVCRKCVLNSAGLEK